MKNNSRPLTARQAAVYRFIYTVHAKTGYGISYRQISRRFRWSSQTAAVGHVRALVRKGLVSADPGIPRSIRPRIWTSAWPMPGDVF